MRLTGPIFCRYVFQHPSCFTPLALQLASSTGQVLLSRHQHCLPPGWSQYSNFWRWNCCLNPCWTLMFEGLLERPSFLQKPLGNSVDFGTYRKYRNKKKLVRNGFVPGMVRDCALLLHWHSADVSLCTCRAILSPLSTQSQRGDVRMNVNHHQSINPFMDKQILRFKNEGKEKRREKKQRRLWWSAVEKIKKAKAKKKKFLSVD